MRSLRSMTVLIYNFFLFSSYSIFRGANLTFSANIRLNYQMLDVGWRDSLIVFSIKLELCDGIITLLNSKDFDVFVDYTRMDFFIVCGYKAAVNFLIRIIAMPMCWWNWCLVLIKGRLIKSIWAWRSCIFLDGWFSHYNDCKPPTCRRKVNRLVFF